jgi:hypothetical protein
MRIDVLTVSGCPHRLLAMTRLREAIDHSGIDAAVVERVIGDHETAATLGMAGSPTILVDGRDLFGSAGSEPSISCRLYRRDTGIDGSPSVSALIDALTSGTAAS